MMTQSQIKIVPPEPSLMYSRVQLMFLQLLVVATVSIMLLFMPEPLGYVIFLISYGILIRFETRINICNWQSRILFLLALFNIGLWPWMNDLSLYVPATMFAVLSAFSIASMLRKQPMTMIYGGGHGHLLTHWRTSALWLVIFALGFVISLLMFQYLWLVLMLPVILIGGVVGTLWLQLYIKTSRINYDKGIIDGQFEYIELKKTRENIDNFYYHYTKETLHQTPNRSNQKPCCKDIAAMARKEEMRNKAVAANQRYLVVRQKGEIVGTISFFLMPDGWELTEIGKRLKIDIVRGTYGDIGLFDHFCIAQKFRNRPSIIQRLIRMAVEASFEADCSFVATFAFANVESLYHKIGFIPLLDEGMPSVYSGAPLKPMMLNLAHAAVCEFEDMQNRGYGKDSLLAETNLGERFFKRQVFRSFFRRIPAWQFDIERSVRGLAKDHTPDVPSS